MGKRISLGAALALSLRAITTAEIHSSYFVIGAAGGLGGDGRLLSLRLIGRLTVTGAS